MKQIDNQLRKLRRRIEEFLRNTTPEMLIKVADICKINVSDNIRNRYISKDNSN